MKKAGWILSTLLLAVTALGGLYNSVNELPDAETGWQLAVGYGQIAYGVFGALGVVGMIRHRPWTVTVVIAWAVSSAFVAGIASFAFHDPAFAQPDTGLGVAAAAISVLVVGALVSWSAHANTRPRAVDAPVPPAA